MTAAATTEALLAHSDSNITNLTASNASTVVTDYEVPKPTVPNDPLQKPERDTSTTSACSTPPEAPEVDTVPSTPDGQSARVIPLQNKKLLRAVSLSKLLHKRGSMLLSETSEEQSYQSSFETEELDYFISHSWRAAPFEKYMALCIEFNLQAALIWSVVAAVATSFLQWCGYLHFLSIHVEYMSADTIKIHQQLLPDGTSVSDFNFPDTSFVGAKVVGAITLLVVLFTRHLWSSKPLQTRVFLDKACIDQTDIHRKREGIDNLGGFLKHTKELVVLWSPDYFERLWCVYEFAAFSYLHPSSRIRLVPLSRSVLYVGLCVIGIAIGLFLDCNRWKTDIWFGDSHSLYEGGSLHLWNLGLYFSFHFLEMMSVIIVPCMAIFYLSYLCAIDQRLLYKQIYKLSLANTQCTDDADRPTLEASIAKWFGTTEAFEKAVRHQMATSSFTPSAAERLGFGLLALPYVFGSLDLAVMCSGVPVLYHHIVVMMAGMAAIFHPITCMVWRRAGPCLFKELLRKKCQSICVLPSNRAKGMGGSIICSKYAFHSIDFWFLLAGGFLEALFFAFTTHVWGFAAHLLPASVGLGITLTLGPLCWWWNEKEVEEERCRGYCKGEVRGAVFTDVHDIPSAL